MINYKRRIGLAALVLVSACAAHTAPQNTSGEEKRNYFTKGEIDAVYDATFRVDTDVTLEEKVDNDNDFEKSWFGSGTLLVDSQTGDSYILTAEHVTPDATYTNNETRKTARVTKGKMQVRGLYEASIVKENEVDDLALLRVIGPITDENGQPARPFKGKIAQKIESGDYVVGVGFPAGSKELFNTSVKKIADDRIYLNIHIVGGNSGGGMYCISERKDFELCSVVINTNNTPSLRTVRGFLGGTPLADDYL